MEQLEKKNFLELLHEAERELSSLLGDAEAWNSLCINYSSPLVERVWRDWQGYRLNLHRIYSDAKQPSLYHPHPWPSAMRLVKGSYEMGIGFGLGPQEPPLAATVVLEAGCEYEMAHPAGWHYVRPLTDCTVSLMITGKPWQSGRANKAQPMLALTPEKKIEILEIFQAHYLQP